MSYPGYPKGDSGYPTQQYTGAEAPYSTNNTSYPSNNAPYPSSNAPYPQGAGVFPPSVGFGMDSPMHMPNAADGSAYPFDPRSDAEVLRKAIKGCGTEDKVILHVLTRRTNAQRLQIIVQFKTLYGEDLISNLKSELPGNFENVITAMMTPLPQYYAKELRRAIFGLATDEYALIEVLCTMSNNEIRTIRQAYQESYHTSLENDLMGDGSGAFKKLMVSLCNAAREESMIVDTKQALHDAQQLLRAGELCLATEESTFNRILCQRNFAQLKMILMMYHLLASHDIEKAIKNEFSGNSEDSMLAIVRAVRNKPAFFARSLFNYMKGAGTEDDNLIRVIVTRSEIDMVDIKREFQTMYGMSLNDKIRDECTGDYKKCLYGLIGEL